MLLERSGDAIAEHIGLSEFLFGATVLAAATSLPELSTRYHLGTHEGLSAGRQRHLWWKRLSASALPLAVVVSGKAVLPDARQATSILRALECC
ncbi:hypothetical protein [Sphingomonas aurantiaca]|uniref:hypothetical protein n=1 Tax=Sphingomonas aurantiaca TaxID=185949 RepID=UPI003A5BBC86